MGLRLRWRIFLLALTRIRSGAGMLIRIKFTAISCGSMGAWHQPGHPQRHLHHHSHSIQPQSRFGRSWPITFSNVCSRTDGGKPVKKILRSIEIADCVGVDPFIGLPMPARPAGTGGLRTRRSGQQRGNLWLQSSGPFQSGFLINRVVILPITIENTGSSADQYAVTCTKESGAR